MVYLSANKGVLCGMITYRRGAYALLVSTRWASFLGASEREASDSAGLHAFFMSCSKWISKISDK